MTTAASQTQGVSTLDAVRGTCVGCQAEVHAARCHECGATQSVHGYTTLRVIARTPHSRVYLAEDEHGRRVALKELLFAQVPDTAAIAAFEREAGMLRQLEHPAIPKLVETFQEGRGPGLRLYLAQEFIAGETLLARLERGTASYHEAEEIARDALDILEYLHTQPRPVFHRDLKPQNLIRRPSGELVLVDFGTARETAAAGTHGATLVGTFGYMPFEQLGGSINASTDLYALGATLIHLLTGKSPADLFQADGTLAFEKEISDPRWRNWLKRLVKRDPAARFQSVAEARKALAASRAALALPRMKHPQVAPEAALEEAPQASLVRRIFSADPMVVTLFLGLAVLALLLTAGSAHQTVVSMPATVIKSYQRQPLELDLAYQDYGFNYAHHGGALMRVNGNIQLELPVELTNTGSSPSSLAGDQLPKVISWNGRVISPRPSAAIDPIKRYLFQPGERVRWTLTYYLDQKNLPVVLSLPNGQRVPISAGELQSAP